MAIISQGILSLLMLMTSDIYTLIDYSAFVESLFIAVSVAGLLWLRYKQPDLPRPIKVLLFNCFILYKNNCCIHLNCSGITVDTDHLSTHLRFPHLFPHLCAPLRGPCRIFNYRFRNSCLLCRNLLEK